MNDFEKLRSKLIAAPILQPPDWSKPFEIMCDASDYALGAVLGHRDDENKLIAIHYASRLFTHKQRNLGVTEKQFSLLVISLRLT